MTQVTVTMLNPIDKTSEYKVCAVKVAKIR
jgi:hypothetical protein